jgi:hypothetical protein
MTINLKQISILDNNNIILDKINYNFDQLITNGGGPKGYIGTNGLTGPQGFQGTKGAQGAQGATGAQGGETSSADSFWTSRPSIPLAGKKATLFPKNSDDADLEYFSIVTAGYTSTNPDTQYNSQQSTDTGLPIYQWVVNRKDNVLSNISFNAKSVKNTFNIKMCNSECNSFKELHLEFKSDEASGEPSPTQLTIESDEFEINSTVDGSILLKTDISETGTTGEIRTNSTFEDTVRFNKKLSLKNPEAGLDKVVTSVDDTGLLTFKSPSYFGGFIRIGTVISILPSIYFLSGKFIMYQDIDAGVGKPDENIPLKIRIGAGIDEYTGWYICNGEEWTNGNTSFDAPDTNGFKYTIFANPVTTDPYSQGFKRKNSSGTRLIGGADFLLNAEVVGTSPTQYNITNETSITESTFNSSSYGTIIYQVKKLPQIIYLGAGDLWWSQLGTGQLVSGDYSASDYKISDYRTIP